MRPTAVVRAGILMTLAILSAMPVGGVLTPSAALAQTDVRQEDRREDRRVDRQQDRREDRREARRADRGGRGR